jgi:hypothetical protein
LYLGEDGKKFSLDRRNFPKEKDEEELLRMSGSGWEARRRTSGLGELLWKTHKPQGSGRRNPIGRYPR